MVAKNLIASLVLAAALASACLGDAATTRPAAVPVPVKKATTTAATAPAVDPAVKKILDALEKTGDRHKTLTALIGYRIDDRMTGDAEMRSGVVKYKKETKTEAAKFYVRFDTLRQGRASSIKDKVEYGFDGMWLTVAKHRLEQMTRYQVAAKGEKVQPLRLGKGPFPLPFGQKTADIVKYFKATTRAARKTDPKNTDCVKLTTRKQYKQEMSFLSLEMWIDRKTHLPVRIRSRDKNKKVTTVIFNRTKTDVELGDTVFHMKRPAGWEYKVERFKVTKSVGP